TSKSRENIQPASDSRPSMVTPVPHVPARLSTFYCTESIKCQQWLHPQPPASLKMMDCGYFFATEVFLRRVFRKCSRI
ncbi:hypothetical protein E3U43_015370, partial [Larimichthys crocea]